LVVVGRERHAVGLDFSREFFKPNQNPCITYQWLAAKNPTEKARHHWWIDSSEVPGGSLSLAAASVDPLFPKPCIRTDLDPSSPTKRLGKLLVSNERT